MTKSGDKIDFTKFSFFLFYDGDTQNTSEGSSEPTMVSKPVIVKMTSLSDPNVAIARDVNQGKNGVYNIRYAIPKTLLNNIIGRTLSSNSENEIKLRLVAFANGADYPWTPSKADNNPPVEITTYSQLMSLANKLTYSMGSIYTEPDMGKIDPPIKELYTGLIPMFGMELITVTEKSLLASSPEQPLHVGDIRMLRSLAKVRVIDKIIKGPKKGFPEGYPKIECVEFSSGRSNGYQLPDNAENYVPGSKVSAPHLIDGYTYPHTYRLGYLSTVAETERFCYVPEQTISGSSPAFVITIRYGANPEDIAYYTVPMTGYLTTTFDFGPNILRNHIYSLEVSMRDETEPTEDSIWFFNVKVEPWTDGGRTHLDMDGEDPDIVEPDDEDEDEE